MCADREFMLNLPFQIFTEAETGGVYIYIMLKYEKNDC